MIAVQADGEGGKLHAHVVMNTIKTNGKTVATNRFNINKLRKDFDHEMQNNYQKVTGRQWNNPIHNKTDRKDIQNLTTKSERQYQLKELITQIKAKVDNIADFLKQLEQYGVTVTERKRGNAWTYHQVVNTKTGCRELKIRDFYQRVDKKSGEIKTTRGLGRSFSKAAIEDYFIRRKKIKRSTIVMDEEKATESNELKPWQKMLGQEQGDNDELTKLLNNSSKKPLMKKREKHLSEKLDYLIKNNVKPEELSELVDKLQNLSDKVNQNNQDVQEKLRAQNSNVLKAVSDAQAIGYSDGLVERIPSWRIANTQSAR